MKYFYILYSWLFLSIVFKILLFSSFCVFFTEHAIWRNDTTGKIIFWNSVQLLGSTTLTYNGQSLLSFFSPSPLSHIICYSNPGSMLWKILDAWVKYLVYIEMVFGSFHLEPKRKEAWWKIEWSRLVAGIRNKLSMY